MKVTITSLEMLEPPADPVELSTLQLPEDVYLECAPDMSPEYARFLYGLVGGPWRWTDRLDWSRDQWLTELSVPGTEFWILYRVGVPIGYAHLYPEVKTDGTHVEIRYFGLVEDAIGQGLGGALLSAVVDAAWTLAERASARANQGLSSLEMPPVVRVWVHTCTLDGPAALANYRARGFAIFDIEDVEEDYPDEPLGAWVSTGGR